nr:YkyA family protein [Ectobacillus ponti]
MLLTAGLLSGCFGPKPEEELYTIFEGAVKKEQSLPEKATQLEKLEKHTYELYDKILQDGKEDSAAAGQSIQQALKDVQERETLLGEEQKLLEAARQEMKAAAGKEKQLKDDSLKKQAAKVEALYTSRYDAFQKMRSSYIQLLGAERQLYTMLQEKQVSLKAISDQVKAVNELNKQVADERTAFNEHTKNYNREKVAFYRTAGLKIKE